MLKLRSTGALATVAALMVSLPAAAAEPKGDDPALTELVQILRQQGVLDEGDYEKLTAKAAKRDDDRWYDRIEMWGDFRSRYEGFFYFKDPVGGQMTRGDRHRLRYRLRLNFKGNVNDYADIFVRLATGDDGRTTNDTLGSTIDWDPNGIFIRKAYVRVSPFKHGDLPDTDGKLYFYFGRTEQPWRWKLYKDWIWDDELDPAGMYMDTHAQINQELELFGNGGLYIIDENSTTKDPAMANMQVGLHSKPSERFDVSGRASWYYFWNLDSGFLARGVSNPSGGGGGNIPGGMTGNPFGGTSNVFQFDAYVKAKLIDKWPVSVYGMYAINTSAHKTPLTSRDGNMWYTGLDLGSSKEYLVFKLMYAYFGANSFPGQFVDSDLFDGFTNGKGWMFNVGRQVAENTTASFTAFLRKPIKKAPGYGVSLPGSDRLRIQANVVYKF